MARQIEMANQLIPLRIQNATNSGFSRFAKRLWSHLEHVLFDEILQAIRTNDTEAYKENQRLVNEISEAMKLFVHTIAKLHGLIPAVPSTESKNQQHQQQQQMDDQIGEFSNATWEKLVDLMKADWGLLTEPYERVKLDGNEQHTNMKHAINKEFYLGIFDGDSNAPDLLRDGGKNYSTVLTDMAQSTRQKKEELQKEIKQMVQKNKDMVKKNALMDCQRVENIKKRTRKMKDYNEETKSIATECHNFVKSSPIFSAEKGVKSIPKQLEIYTERVNAFRHAQRCIKLNGYASSLPLMCTSHTYRQWKQLCADPKKIEREPVPDWLKAGKKLKVKLSNHEKYRLDDDIRSRLRDCDTLITQAKDLSRQALERYEASKTKEARPWLFCKVARKDKKNETALCLWYEVDDMRQALENLEGMVYNYLKDPITFGEKMAKEKCFK